jgi:nicotinamidase-related amidase
MPPRHSHLLRREDMLLVVVDMQEPFLRSIHDRDRLTDNVKMLVQAANTLSVPVLTTIQYGSRMGGVIPELAPLISAAHWDKMCFSCMGLPEFREAVQTSGRRQVLLCGIETHICVAQTAMDLVADGFQAHVAADAVSSRTLERHKLGMERLRDSGVFPCAAEAAIYELLREAGTPEFKSLLKLVK